VVAQVVEQEDELERIRRRLLKVELAAPGLRSLVDGMHEENPNVRHLRGGQRSEHGVPEEMATDPLALGSDIDREAGEQHGRDRIGHVPSDTTRRVAT